MSVVCFPDPELFPPGTLEECACSFEGTCPVEGGIDGNGVGATGGCADGDGAMLVLNGFPSFLGSKLNYMSTVHPTKRRGKFNRSIKEVLSSYLKFGKFSNFTGTGPENRLFSMFLLN